MSRTLSGLISGDTDLDVSVSLADVPASIITSGRLSADRLPLAIPKSAIASNDGITSALSALAHPAKMNPLTSSRTIP